MAIDRRLIIDETATGRWLMAIDRRLIIDETATGRWLMAIDRRLIIDETATDQWFIGDRSAIGPRTIADRLEGGFKNARLIAERLPTNHAAPTGRHSVATSRREVAD